MKWKKLIYLSCNPFEPAISLFNEINLCATSASVHTIHFVENNSMMFYYPHVFVWKCIGTGEITRQWLFIYSSLSSPLHSWSSLALALSSFWYRIFEMVFHTLSGLCLNFIKKYYLKYLPYSFCPHSWNWAAWNKRGLITFSSNNKFSEDSNCSIQN